MYKKITGQILGIFFIFCGIGSMITIDGLLAWPVAALFMLAGFMAIPLPNNRKLLILRYVLTYRNYQPVSNKQLQAMRITSWPGLAFSFVFGGIAIYYMTISFMSPPLPTEKADTNHFHVGEPAPE